MKNKIIVPTILFIFILIFSFIVLLQKENRMQPEINKSIIVENQQNQLIFFYGENCPHCTIVEEFIEQNQVKSRLSIVQKEVYYNQDHTEELAEKAKICGIPVNSIGVPFFWDGEKCFVGDKDIIDYLKQKIGLN